MNESVYVRITLTDEDQLEEDVEECFPIVRKVDIFETHEQFEGEWKLQWNQQNLSMTVPQSTIVSKQLCSVEVKGEVIYIWVDGRSTITKS